MPVSAEIIKEMRLGLWIIRIFLGLCTLLLFLWAFWLFYPYHVIDFKGDYKMPTVVYQGESTFYDINYCKYMDLPATINREFVDGLTFQASNPQATLYVGCRTQQVPITIPQTLPAGNYQLRNTVTYQVNPIRTAVYVHYSNWFTVKPTVDSDFDSE